MKEKYLLSIFSKISITALELISSYLLILNLKTSLVGLWIFFISIINLTFLLIHIGFDLVHFQHKDNNNKNVFFGTYFVIKISLILISILIFIFLISILDLWSSNALIIIFLLLISRILFIISDIFLWDLKKNLRIFKSEMPLILTQCCKNIIIIFIALNLDYLNNPLFLLALSHLFCDSILIILSFFISRNEIKIYKPTKEILISYLKDTKPLIIYSIVFIISNNIGIIIIALTLGYESLVYYGFISNYVITVLTIISPSIRNLSIALYTNYFKNNEISLIRNTSYRLEKYLSIMYLIFIIITYLNADLIFSIFLPKYSRSISILYIMIFIPYLTGITHPYELILSSGKKQKTTAKIDSFVNTLIIFLMIILIPSTFFNFSFFGLGILGAAIAQTTPWILWVILYRYYSIKFYNIKPQLKTIYHCLSAGISIFFSYIIKIYILMEILHSDLLLLIISSFLAIVLFFILLIIIGELNKNDIEFFFKHKSYLINQKLE